jgi:hypothetical protein
MSRQLDKDDLIQHKKQALKKLNDYMDSLINSDDIHLQGKSDKLSYWIEDWSVFLDFESHFSPASLRKYKRGEIVKVHLGFNVGSEEGGLHYAVVIDKNNSLHSPVLTIIPLTSVKPQTDTSRLRRGNVFLGNELFTSLNAKVIALQRLTDTERKHIHELIEQRNEQNVPESELDSIGKRLNELNRECELLQRTKKEISKMKSGSIALVSQVRTISKIRIYDPKTNYDVLSNIKLSNEKLDLIDSELIALYTRG